MYQKKDNYNELQENNYYMTPLGKKHSFHIVTALQDSLIFSGLNLSLKIQHL